MKQRQYRLGLCALALAAGLLPLAAQGGDVWLSAGPVWRGGMDVKFSGSSYAQTLGLNTDVGVGIGAASAYADRTYDDGYVNKDSSLGGGSVPNTTWNWGYNTPGQYNAAAPQTLTFQKQGIPRIPPSPTGALAARMTCWAPASDSRPVFRSRKATNGPWTSFSVSKASGAQRASSGKTRVLLM